MCGIDGVASLEPARTSLADVGDMNRSLRHRGPDEGGALDLGFARLGMRRLAIVDRVGGRQPMRSPADRLALVYNGEIYDGADLAVELERKGTSVRGSSDTQLLAALWEDEGRACLERLNGIFAFAVADRRDRSLTLVRDALGVKPLFYWQSPSGDLVFASEISALLAHPEVPRRLDHASLAMLLADRYVAAPWTLLEGVRELPPGHLLRWQGGRIELSRWADPRPEPEPMDEPTALRELEAALEQALSSQLAADVPVGVFLSGGIDSSMVAAMATAQSSQPVDSFSIGFERAEYDESELARQVAHHLGTRHHEAHISEAAFDVAMLDRIVRYVGQPLGDASCVPTWVLSRLAREHVGVALSGDGGDELFGGYDHVRWAAHLRRSSERVPSGLRRLAGRVLQGGGPGLALASAPMSATRREAVAAPLRRLRKGLDLSFYEPVEQFRRMRGLWSPEELQRLLSPSGHRQLRAEHEAVDRALLQLEPEELALALLTRTYLPGAILTKVDRMSMAVGLEVRVPLLDRRVFELARRLPLELKMRAGQGKVLLRKLGQTRLPSAVFRHRKQGFSLPLSSWLTPEFWELLESLFRPGSPAAGLFEPALLREAIANGRSAGRQATARSETHDATRAWVLAMFGRWMEHFEVQV